ncbi:MAG: extracellular solute-binding protein, partial [Microbacterium sp.]
VKSEKTTFEDPVFVESVDLLTQLQKYMPSDVTAVSYTDAQTLFISEQAGMFPGGSFEVSFFRGQNPDLKLGMFPVPPVDGAPLDEGVVTAYQDGSFAINASSDKQKAAAELLSWMTTQEFGQMFTDQVSQLSPVKNVKITDELLEEIVATYDQNPQKYLLYTDFRWGTPAASDIFNPGVQALFLGSTDAAQLARELQQGISQWLTTS